MKLHSILFIFITSINLYTLHAQQNNQLPPNIHIHFNPINSAHINQNNSLDQQAHHVSAPETDVATNVTSKDDAFDFKQLLYDMYQEQSKKIHEASVDMTGWAANNKIKTTACAILLCYSIIAYQIYQANMIINDTNSWSNWHNSRSLEDLFTTPQNKLEADLLFEIQTRYVHPVNPTDFIYSLVQSSISLNKEIKTLDQQISRYQLIAKCGCMPIFFIETQDLVSLQEKHRKLGFIKYIFSSWCANYKIDKNI